MARRYRAGLQKRIKFAGRRSKKRAVQRENEAAAVSREHCSGWNGDQNCERKLRRTCSLLYIDWISHCAAHRKQIPVSPSQSSRLPKRKGQSAPARSAPHSNIGTLLSKGYCSCSKVPGSLCNAIRGACKRPLTVSPAERWPRTIMPVMMNCQLNYAMRFLSLALLGPVSTHSRDPSSPEVSEP